ncbi:MAG: class I SAM-dependent methyltransferase [Candidatus Omnitrophota bacterium]
MSDIANTGERILIEKETPSMIARHFFAYHFSRGYVEGKKVLDIGCGEGYGVHYLASLSKEALGIDYCQEAVIHAKDKYKKTNLRFACLDINHLDQLSESFDVICSFQVIEHLDNPHRFLSSVKAKLNKNGVFICSTPNKEDASPGRQTPLNTFHVKEYGHMEFSDLLGEHFKTIALYGLKRGVRFNFYRRLKKSGLLRFIPAYVNPVDIFYNQISWSDYMLTIKRVETALDFIAVCQNT